MAEAPRGPERILEGLNPPQAAAVTHETGPLLIIAGAGTGKTTVITRRIAHLIATRRPRPPPPHRPPHRAPSRAPRRDPRAHVHRQGGGGDGRARGRPRALRLRRRAHLHL